MSADEREVMARLAALEAEVKADAEAKRVRKAEVIAQLRERQAKKLAEEAAAAPAKAAVKALPAPKAEPAAAKAAPAKPAPVKPALAKPAPVKPAAAKPAPVKPAPKAVARPEPEEEEDDDLDLESALAVAKGARLAKKTKDELAKPIAAGEKSWIASGLLSLLFGPVGWLYAGSLRESIPASAAWILAAAIITKILPMVLLMPVLMVALPISGIAGVVYAIQHNRHGKRTRLWGKDDPNLAPKKLPAGED